MELERIFRARYDQNVDRMLSKRRAGAYGLDRVEPESTDIPDVCAFSKDGLLPNSLLCKGTLIVILDIRFGVIPVCNNHKPLTKRRVYANQAEDNRRYEPPGDGCYGCKSYTGLNPRPGSTFT